MLPFRGTRFRNNHAVDHRAIVVRAVAIVIDARGGIEGREDAS